MSHGEEPILYAPHTHATTLHGALQPRSHAETLHANNGSQLNGIPLARLPRKPILNSKHMLAPSSIPAASPTRVGKGLIYVVDDEAVIGEVVEVILGLEGYQSKIFHNPKDALHAIANGETLPDLLLTDFAMTPLNGMELIERVRDLHPEMKIILYSGNVGEEVMQRYRSLPNAFLAKPFLPKTLLALIDKVIHQAKTPVA